MQNSTYYLNIKQTLGLAVLSPLTSPLLRAIIVQLRLRIALYIQVEFDALWKKEQRYIVGAEEKN